MSRAPSPGVRAARALAPIAACLATAHAAHAGDPRSTAAALYDRAVSAEARGRHAEAARLFAEADEAVPNDVALEAALRAAVVADDVPLGMELAERASSRAMAGPLVAAADDVRARLGPRAGRVRVACPPAARCTAELDGSPMPVDEARWARVGPHEVRVAVGLRREARTAVVERGRITEITADAATVGEDRGAEAAPPGAATHGAGLAPGWLWLGAGLTAAGAVATVASFADTAARHSAFEQHPTADAASSGRAAEARSFTLLGVTAGLLVATTVVGVVVLRAPGPPRRSASPRTVALGVGPGGLVAAGRF
jgi:hypothetical protein